jgi:hypothetical protein
VQGKGHFRKKPPAEQPQPDQTGEQDGDLKKVGEQGHGELFRTASIAF